MNEKIQKALEDELEKIDALGALCALNVNGHIETYSSGNISPEEHGLSFYIYSISKSITAAAVMLLSEKRVVDIDQGTQARDNTIYCICGCLVVYWLIF